MADRLDKSTQRMVVMLRSLLVISLLRSSVPILSMSLVLMSALQHLIRAGKRSSLWWHCNMGWNLCAEYIDFLSRVTPDHQQEFLDQMKRFNLGTAGEADCPVYDGMFEYFQVICPCETSPRSFQSFLLASKSKQRSQLQKPLSLLALLLPMTNLQDFHDHCCQVKPKTSIISFAI